jgi:hypothetical protein
LRQGSFGKILFMRKMFLVLMLFPLVAQAKTTNQELTVNPKVQRSLGLIAGLKRYQGFFHQQ